MKRPGRIGPRIGPPIGHAGPRLFQHDCRIVANAIRATFRLWHDRLIAAVMLAVLVIGLRSVAGGQPLTTALWAGGTAALAAGLLAGRGLAGRLAFHAADGVLAADALRPGPRRAYAAAWQAIALAAVVILSLAAAPALPIVTVPAYLVGGLLGHAGGRVTLSGPGIGRVRLGRTIWARLRRPAAGAAAGLILIAVAATAQLSTSDAVLPVLGVATVLLVLALTAVDDGAVRFMTVTGAGSGRIILRHSRGTLLLLAVAVPVLLLAIGAAAAGVVGGLAATGLLLMAMRILAYRVHGRRVADLAVSLAAGALALVALSLPILLPIVLCAILWRLHRDASARTWLIA